MARAFLVVLDSVGCGAAADAHLYGDAGSNTLGHIAQACAAGKADKTGVRAGPLHIPNLAALGLPQACALSAGTPLAGVPEMSQPQGQYGFGIEISQGKDTPSGHWEMTGCPVPFQWGYFTALTHSFPDALIAAVIQQGALPGILGNCHASGTAIIDALGVEHMKTGKPICYTSVDSVFQIAAHEETFGLERLYALCRSVRTLVDPLNIGRVIARPFVGTGPGHFTRTANRKDFAIPPPSETILDRAHTNNRAVISIGKIGDIFAHRNTGHERKGKSNAEHVALLMDAVSSLPDGGFCFANLVDFDTEYGHRRDVAGYAACLEAFDQYVPALRAALRAGDMCIITADHGNDPTWQGTDHTREHVPILAFGPDSAPGSIGARRTFADIGATVSAWLKLGKLGPGTGW
ncbi:MAG: phosphopentomutase [Beijerinckiaceae bacterium]